MAGLDHRSGDDARPGGGNCCMRRYIGCTSIDKGVCSRRRRAQR
jgi:hypothetical protein